MNPGLCTLQALKAQETPDDGCHKRLNGLADTIGHRLPCVHVSTTLVVQ
jgi:hypothetical protein